MGENAGKDPIGKGMDQTCVLALEAPSLSGSSARPRRPRKMKARTDGTGYPIFVWLYNC